MRGTSPQVAIFRGMGDEVLRSAVLFSARPYSISPRRSPCATAWVRLTASSFLAARFR